MNRKMTASTLAALGFLFQAACGAAPESDTGATRGGTGGATSGATGDPTGVPTGVPEFLTRPYVEDLAETDLQMEQAAMPAEAGGADRLFRGEFLFAGQFLQDPTCNYTLQMGNLPAEPGEPYVPQTHGGLNTFEYTWWPLPYWGAGNSSPYNYAAFWYPTESGGNANFLVLSRAGNTLWETNTWGTGAYEVVQQVDAHVVMYASGGYVPWASNQVYPQRSSLCSDAYYGRLVGMKTKMRAHKDLWGADYAAGPSPTLGNCGSSCATDPNCHSFTYYNGWCYLKNGQPAESYLPYAYSGRKMNSNHGNF